MFASARRLLQGWRGGFASARNFRRDGFASARRLLQGWRDGVCLGAVHPPRLEGWRLSAAPPRLDGWLLLERGISSKVGGVVLASARRNRKDALAAARHLLQGWRGGVASAWRHLLQGWRDGFCFSAACPTSLEGWFRFSAQKKSERRFCFSAAPPPRLEGWCLPQRGASSKVGGMAFASPRRFLQGWRDCFCFSGASPPRLDGWFLFQRA